MLENYVECAGKLTCLMQELANQPAKELEFGAGPADITNHLKRTQADDFQERRGGFPLAVDNLRKDR